MNEEHKIIDIRIQAVLEIILKRLDDIEKRIKQLQKEIGGMKQNEAKGIKEI